MEPHPTQHDPVERLQATTRRVKCLALACALAALLWAIWPLWSRTRDEAPPAPSIAAAGQPQRTTPTPLDIRPFDVALWVPPPAPPPKDVVVPAPPPPPLKLQLLAIAGDGSASSPMQAALYDPDSDRVILIAQGDKLATFTVRVLTSDSVELADGARIERLSLREPSRNNPNAGASR